MLKATALISVVVRVPIAPQDPRKPIGDIVNEAAGNVERVLGAIAGCIANSEYVPADAQLECAQTSVRVTVEQVP